MYIHKEVQSKINFRTAYNTGVNKKLLKGGPENTCNESKNKLEKPHEAKQNKKPEQLPTVEPPLTW